MRAAGLARHGSASRRMLIPENSRGCGLRCFVLPHLGDARTVVVQDGYVRTQLERLRELAEMARSCGVRRIEVIAKPWRPDDADAAASDPLLALADSVGGIEWSLRTSTVHHDRQIKILHDSGGVTVDLGRELDMYYSAQSRHEDQTNSDTLRTRETVVRTRVWTSRDAAPAQSSKRRGTTAAQDLSTRPTRKLRRLAQRLRALARAHCAGQLLDAQQRRALQRRRAVELALSWRRQPGLRSEPSLGEAWTCPVPLVSHSQPAGAVSVHVRAARLPGAPGSREFRSFVARCSATPTLLAVQAVPAAPQLGSSRGSRGSHAGEVATRVGGFRRPRDADHERRDGPAVGDQ